MFFIEQTAKNFPTHNRVTRSLSPKPPAKAMTGLMANNAGEGLVARSCYAGIDGGGTHSRMKVADEDMRLLCEVFAGTTNLSATEDADVQKNLQSLFAQAKLQCAQQHGIIPSFCRIAIGTAGVGKPGVETKLTTLLKEITGCEKVIVTGDMIPPLYAYAASQTVMVIIAGTGAICYAKNPQGVTARTGGWGHILGDEGGAYWLSRRALTACMRAHDGRDPSTALTPLLLSHFHCASPPELLSPVYAAPFDKGRLAQAAVCVTAAAEKGDATAVSLLEEAADKLWEMAEAAARVTGKPDAVLLGGGVLLHSPYLRKKLQTQLHGAFPHSKTVLIDGTSRQTDAAWGAVIISKQGGL